MTKHYTRIQDGVPVELMRRLPPVLETVEKYNDKGEPDPEGEPNKCWTPDAIEEQGLLPLYGFEVFDSKPATLTVHDTEQALTIDDVKMVDSKPTGTHQKTTTTPLQLRRRLFAEGQELLRRTDWTQTVDYVERHPLKAKDWDTWRHGVRTKVKALKADTIDPFTTTFDAPPEPIEDDTMDVL